MAWQCGAAAAGEQGEPIGQAVEDLLRREDTGRTAASSMASGRP